MPMFRVRYSSLTASYGPSFIEADDEQQAKRLFAKGAFSQGEMALITARPVSFEEARRALAEREGS